MVYIQITHLQPALKADFQAIGDRGKYALREFLAGRPILKSLVLREISSAWQACSGSPDQAVVHRMYSAVTDMPPIGDRPEPTTEAS